MAVGFLGMVGAALLGWVPAHPAAAAFPRSASTLSDPLPSNALPTPASQPLHVAYAQLPLGFEANQGQSDAKVKFLARGSGYSLFLTSDEAVLALQTTKIASVVRMRLAGADRTAPLHGTGELPGKSNYFIGNNPAQWHRDVLQFARVRYQHIYPGIDLLYYGNQGRLEYDFEVAPGADPKQIALNFAGPQKLALDGQGNLVLATASGQVRFEAPRLYQKFGEEQRPVEGRFALRADGAVGFALGAYDRTRTLIIDPVLNYSTYLGGTGAESCSAITGAPFTPGCPAIAVDSALNMYVAGATTSTVNFPTPGTPATTNTVKGPADVFITKINNPGTTLAYTSYLGGSGTDTPAGIGVDSGFAVVVAGTTNSTDFPAVSGYQTAPESSGNNHVFVTKLDIAGNVVYSTYLSGTGNDVASGVALDVNGKAYVTGTTTSTDTPSASDVFPATVGAVQTKSLATNQFFLTMVNPAASGTASVPYSTYFGGGNPTNGVAVGGGIAVDQNTTPDVYITGGTNFLDTQASPQSAGGNDFPILNAAQACLDVPTATTSNVSLNCPTPPPTATDAFIAKFTPSATPGSQLLYSTYVGGTGNDVGYAIAVDSGGIAYITGSTNSTDFPVAIGTVPFQPCPDDSVLNPTSCPVSSGDTDAFVAKVTNFTSPVAGASPVSVSLIYISYLGGSGNDAGTGISVDTVGGARVTGWTDSTDFPVQTPVQATSGGGRDAFVANINTVASSVCVPAPTATPPVVCPSYSSYLGGNGTDMGTSIAVDTQGSTYVAGETTSTNFPLLGPLQGALSGTNDAFVTKFSPALNLAMTATATPSPVGVGSGVTYKYTIVNNGDTANGVTFTDNLPPATTATFTSATVSSGSCGTVNGTTVQCNVGSVTTTPSGSAGPTVSVVLTPLAPNPPSTTQLPNLGNSATVSVPGQSFQASASASAAINDFNLSASPAAQTVAAGAVASYQVKVTPTGAIPNTVSLGVTSSLPTGATAIFTAPSFPNLNNGPQFSTLNISTTARVTTTTQLRRDGPHYALLLPISGFALLGVAGGKTSRRRRWLLGILAGVFLVLLGLTASCGSTPTTTVTTGTPAGQYTVIITSTSGSASRAYSVVMTVQ
jgi:hypothetical protein